MIKRLKYSIEKLNNLYLKGVALGDIQGELTGKASLDKPWLKFYSDEMILSDSPQMCMADLLYECNKDNLDITAIEYFGSKITYKKLFEKIDIATKGFAQIGIKKGDVVSIIAPYIPEVVYSIYGLNKIGAIANMIDPRVPTEVLKRYLINSDAKFNSKYVIMLDLCCRKFEQIYSEMDLKKVLTISSKDSLPFGLYYIAKAKEKNNMPMAENAKYITWKTFAKNALKYKQTIHSCYEVNQPAIIVYTSGTSGPPKGALSSNESFNNMAFFQNDSIVNTKVGDKFLLIMPPFIAYGLAIGLHGQLCAGQTLVMIPAFNIDNSAQMLGALIKRHKPQTVMGVPTFMVDLIKHPAMQNLNCGFLKNIIVGGDSMVPEQEVQINSFFKARNSAARISKGWGLTEVNSCFSYTKNLETNPVGSVGIPVLGNNIKIVSPISEEDSKEIDFDELEELQYNQIGEIFVTSPTAIIDYVNDKEESKKVFYKSKTDGKTWIRTMDLGYITKNGLIYIEGRMKRIIIRPDGHNISPFAIEKIINAHNMVENSAVVGRPSAHHKHGSYAVAYIQLKDEYKELSQKVLQEINEEISRKLPPRDGVSFYELIDEIPLTNIGKTDFKRLEELEKANSMFR